ncbi:MAG: dynamin family protein [Rhodomicrobium sp.]
MDLRDYERHKFEIADILRKAAGFAESESRQWQERLHDLFVRLAEDRFNLVVVGRFSRGKTTLMNAILATDCLPTGIVPITSVITSVAYGSNEKVIIQYYERRLDGEIPLGELPKYITQEGNPGNTRGVKLAEVRLPAEILRRGFYFVDTPGLGSAISENTRTTEGFLPEGDAFLLVTSYDSPLSSEEIELVRSIAASSRPLFIAVNKHDAVSGEERENALAFVRNQLEEAANGSIRRIFSVSARDGLEAKRRQDRSLLDNSGIHILEEELVRFLLTEKSARFLAGMCERARDLLQPLSSPEAAALLNQVYALRSELGHANHDGTANPMSPSAASANLASCEVCRRISDALFNFLKHHQHDLCVSHDVRQGLAERNGLCSFHTRQLETVSSQQGLCEGYPPLFERWSVALREAVRGTELAAMQSNIRALLPGRESCFVCNLRVKEEAEAITSLAASLSRDASRSASELSALCFPHFAMLGNAISDVDLLRGLTLREADILERVAEDMRRYALKRDARRRYLTSAEEDGAADRGILLASGRRQVGFT